MDPRNIEEQVARELLHYFTASRETVVNFEDQPAYVQDLWLGAARVAIRRYAKAREELAAPTIVSDQPIPRRGGEAQ